MSEIVLDASAILAAVNREPGGDRVERLEKPALVSAVNFAEARARMLDRGATADAADAALQLVDMTVCDFDAEQARLSSDLRLPTRAAGLSLGDRACLALAMTRKAKALTADRAWRRVELSLDIEIIR